MKLTVASEVRFLATPDNQIWSDAIDYGFSLRYLQVFGAVEYIARVASVQKPPPHFKRADGEAVSFIPLPSYIGPAQYLKKVLRIRRIAAAAAKDAEAVLLRVPGQVSNSFFPFLRVDRRPFGVEVVGDPYDVFAPGSIDHPFRVFLRWWGTRQLKAQCREAVGSSYVTSSGILQQRYPNPNVMAHYSDIDLYPEAFAQGPKTSFGRNGIYRIVFVGSLAQLYKAPDVMISAVAECQRDGVRVNLDIIGAGKYRTLLEQQVKQLGLQETVHFLGQIPAGQAVRDGLVQSDLFVLPSLTEGLPRAMIEAMACGLPCIGSNVGGIPELLPESDMVPPGQAQALADKIGEVLRDPVRLRAMSARNLEKAREYQKDCLDQRRYDFYRYLYDSTEVWLKERSHRP